MAGEEARDRRRRRLGEAAAGVEEEAARVALASFALGFRDAIQRHGHSPDCSRYRSGPPRPPGHGLFMIGLRAPPRSCVLRAKRFAAAATPKIALTSHTEVARCAVILIASHREPSNARELPPLALPVRSPARKDRGTVAHVRRGSGRRALGAFSGKRLPGAALRAFVGGGATVRASIGRGGARIGDHRDVADAPGLHSDLHPGADPAAARGAGGHAPRVPGIPDRPSDAAACRVWQTRECSTVSQSAAAERNSVAAPARNRAAAAPRRPGPSGQGPGPGGPADEAATRSAHAPVADAAADGPFPHADGETVAERLPTMACGAGWRSGGPPAATRGPKPVERWLPGISRLFHTPAAARDALPMKLKLVSNAYGTHRETRNE